MLKANLHVGICNQYRHLHEHATIVYKNWPVFIDFELIYNSVSSGNKNSKSYNIFKIVVYTIWT